jgi:hypothetical protein
VERLKKSINGPSLIRTPEWLPGRLARYYLYFANHSGDHIRLAIADDLLGPWRMHPGGVLHLEQTGFCHHIASPDVHVDHERRQVRLYFHGPLPPEERGQPPHRQAVHPLYPLAQAVQMTRVATSGDGLRFDVHPPLIGTSYLRVFRHAGWHYGIIMPLLLSRSRDGLTNWEAGPSFFDHRTRHCAVLLRESRLHVFFSRRGDCPESILMTTLDLSGDWRDWQPSPPVTLLEPEMEWEGAQQPLLASELGAPHGFVRQLRDPGVFEEAGKTYLLYSVGGESGIAIAELRLDK